MRFPAPGTRSLWRRRTLGYAVCWISCVKNGYPKKSSAHLPKGTESRFRFIKPHRKEFSVKKDGEGSRCLKKRLLCLGFA